MYKLTVFIPAPINEPYQSQDAIEQPNRENETVYAGAGWNAAGSEIQSTRKDRQLYTQTRKKNNNNIWWIA